MYSCAFIGRILHFFCTFQLKKWYFFFKFPLMLVFKNIYVFFFFNYMLSLFGSSSVKTKLIARILCPFPRKTVFNVLLLIHYAFKFKFKRIDVGIAVLHCDLTYYSLKTIPIRFFVIHVSKEFLFMHYWTCWQLYLIFIYW